MIRLLDGNAIRTGTPARFQPGCGVRDTMRELIDLINANEEWLMERVLSYARERGYTKYTSTLKEAWRLSISGLSDALGNAVVTYESVPEMSPEENFEAGAISEFAIVEAQRHRQRGINLAMFLGLFKYYRQAYVDLLVHPDFDKVFSDRRRLFLDRCFDRIEIGFCSEWSRLGHNDAIEELQSTNRFLVNEKNKYLTIFESLSRPAFFLDAKDCIDNINRAASAFLGRSEIPGSEYYCRIRDRSLEYSELGDDARVCTGCLQDESASTVLPWLRDDLRDFTGSSDSQRVVEKSIQSGATKRHFEVQFMSMLDVSGKFAGSVVVINDITRRKTAEQERERLIIELQDAFAEVRKLSGMLPICAACKKIRDDEGYWQQIESYITERSDAQFSHSICPDCAKRLYPELNEKMS